jgi:hypothetical protein
MQPYQPHPALTARRPILSFTAGTKIAAPEPAYAPQHDFLVLSLSPQLSAHQPAAALPAKRDRTRAA